MSALPVEAVFFDIGETLFDRTREYAAWARWFDTTPHTFSAVFGAVVAAGGGVADVVERLRPGATAEQVRTELGQAGALPPLSRDDLYPGALHTLHDLRARGLRVGIAGNQPPHVGAELRALALPADVVLTSSELGCAKPDPRFFAEVAAAAGAPAQRVLYVGDQLGNDVLAAADAGLPVVRVLTGPWGALRRDRAAEKRCVGVLASVAGLPALLDGLGSGDSEA